MLLFFVAGTLSNAQPWKARAAKENPSFFEIQKNFREYWEGRKIERSKGWKPFKRWEWFMESRVNESGYLDANALWRAWEEKQENFAGSPSNSSNWTNLGPQRVIPVNGGAGRLNCITIDPVNQNLIWVGAASGGLWKSTDCGLTWNSNTDKLPVLGVSAIAINPLNTSVMYIATGDGDANETYSIGVLKSTDGGETWNTTGLSWVISSTSKVSINSLWINPVNPQILIAATSSGIYRTSDGGATWSQKANGLFKELDANPQNPDIIYSCRMLSTASNSPLYKSTDGGVTWSPLAGGLPYTEYYRPALAIARSNPSTLYLLLSGLDDGYYGLYKSTNSGSSWTLQSNSPNLLGWETDGSDLGGQGWYDLAIEVSPVNENTVYVGGVNIWKSTNAGVNWTISAHWYGDGGKPYVHADHHAFLMLPGNGNVLYSCNDGGLFKTTNGGTSWTDLSNGLGIQQFYRIGVSKSNPSMVIGGSQDNGTNLLNGAWTNVLGGDGMEAAIDPVNPKIMYGEYYYGMMSRSTDGGVYFTSIDNGITEDGDWVSPFVLHPKNSSILYRGTTKLYKSTNRGTNWTSLFGPVGGGAITSIAIAPSDVNYIYISNRTYLYRTTNGGTTWTKSTTALPQISYLAVHPDDPNMLFIVRSTYSGGSKVSKSTDGGTSWISLMDNLPEIPVNCIAIHPFNGNQIYIGTDLGVFYSSTGGGAWQEYNTNLPNVIVNELEIHESENKLYAATYGRGLWTSPLENPKVPVELISLKATGRQGSVLIEWSTATETNNRGFEIERKSGNSWIFSGFVKGKGTVTEKSSYSFTDKHAPVGKAVYRIKQVDYDGTVNFARELTADVIPGEFSLGQNYPNPFNPVTTINYTVPVNSVVSLKVYDMTGREVSTLASGHKEAGSYEVKFDASGLTSGIYLYELRAGGYTQAKKLAVIK